MCHINEHDVAKTPLALPDHALKSTIPFRDVDDRKETIGTPLLNTHAQTNEKIPSEEYWVRVVSLTVYFTEDTIFPLQEGLFQLCVEMASADHSSNPATWLRIGLMI